MDRKQVNTRRNKLLSARWVAALLVVFSLGAAGCGLLGLDGSSGQHKGPPPGAHKQAATPPPAPKPKATAQEEYERPDYPDNVRRNPFLPDLDVLQPKHDIAKGDVRPLEPLEQYELGQLQLVAIISEVAVPKAMFLDPKGFGHVVKEGDRIGQNGGTITDIRDNEVEVREVTDEEETQTRLTTVKLRTKELETKEDHGLTDQEREALKKLLASQKGRQALQKTLGQAGAPTGADGESGVLPPK